MNTLDFPFDFLFEIKPRNIYDHYITMDGIKFDAGDLLETLEHVYAENGIYTTAFHPDAAQALHSHGILESQGNSRSWSPAKLGPRGNEFIRYLEGLIRHSMAYDEE